MSKQAAPKSETYSRLKSIYPDTSCPLNFRSVWQLLVATILSAQCTDARVNLVTRQLFAKYPDVYTINNLELEELKKEIRSINFYNNKARFIKEAARMIIEKYDGKVPGSIRELTSLPGVARKTANVVMGEGIGVNEGIAVDTHVKRVSTRLGWSAESDPVKIEADLMRLFPKEKWRELSILLILHGRNICVARKPKCNICPLKDICPSASEFLAEH